MPSPVQANTAMGVWAPRFFALRRANRPDVLATSAVVHLVYVEKDPKRYEHLVEMLATETVPNLGSRSIHEQGSV